MKLVELHHHILSSYFSGIADMSKFHFFSSVTNLLKRVSGPITLISILLLSPGCSEDLIEDLATDRTVWEDDRQYLATWSLEEVPLLEVKVAYLGKKPDLPFEGVEPTYDWTERNTDFYSIAIRNLTDQPIELTGVQVEMDKGKMKKATRYGSSYLLDRWRTTIIPPKGSIKRRNTWVWGKGDRNTLIKTYGAKIVSSDHSLSSETESVLKPEERSPSSFSFKTHLKFIR